MGFFYDPTIPLLIAAIIFGLIAQHRVHSTFARYSKVSSTRGLTGAQAAKLILEQKGLSDVRIERIGGNLTDHYDPRSKVLRLSVPVFGSTSLAAIGVAAHEAGHALQDAEGYAPMRIRHAIFPLANLGSQMLFPAIILGFFMQMKPLLYIGIFLYFFAVLFSVVTLPVEFDASRRALKELSNSGFLVGKELDGARQVLRAAAMTYVAATLVSVLQLIRLLVLARSSD